MTKHTVFRTPEASSSTTTPRPVPVSLAGAALSEPRPAAPRRRMDHAAHEGWTAQQARACREMWGAVLMRNLQDALTPDDRLTRGGSGVEFGDRRNAQDWVGSRGFAITCALAGFDPDFILDAYKSGRIDYRALAQTNHYRQRKHDNPGRTRA